MNWWRLRKKRGSEWLDSLLTDYDAWRTSVEALFQSLRTQGADEVTPLPSGRALKAAARHILDTERAAE